MRVGNGMIQNDGVESILNYNSYWGGGWVVTELGKKILCPGTWEVYNFFFLFEKLIKKQIF